MESKDKLMESRYRIEKMDCPSEEQMIRMKLVTADNIINMNFDIGNRELTIVHSENNELITKLLEELNLDSTLSDCSVIESEGVVEIDETNQRKLLWIVLFINFGFFVIEMVTGVISKSMGLVADSLDMFADAAVYGLSLIAIGKALSKKKLVAKLAGYFQFSLAVIGFIEVIRRFFGLETLPHFQTMIGVSILALIANTISLFILQKTKSTEAHMQASMIFTSNDIIVNGGVIVAGILVNILSSKVPDLVIGGIVFAIVLRGSLRILSLAK